MKEINSSALKLDSTTVLEQGKQYVESPEDLIDYSEEEEKKLVRKLDRIVLPIMCLVFFSQYLDKQVLSYTVVYGLRTDLKLAGDQYSWLTSGFYIAQLVSQIWNTYALSRFPIKIVTGVCVIIWGAVCMCLAAPDNFGGFLAVRILLGFFEGAVSPAFVIITSVYYRKSEHAVRTACWVSCNALAQVIGNFLVYGIGQNPNLSIAVWKVTFLVCGGLTIAFGIVFILMLPFSPAKAWFLSERERHIAVRRLLVESDRGERQSFNVKQIVQSLKFDWVVICSFLFGFLITVTSGPITFASLIISEMGYTGDKTLELGSPSGAIQLVLIWVGVLLCKLFPRERCFIIMFLSLVPLVGTILLLALPEENQWGRIVASWLGACILSFMSTLLSLNASNARGNTRKSIVNNCFFLGYCLAAIVYPQWWNYSVDPTYRRGLIANICFWGFFLILVFFYRSMCIYENKKKERLIAEGKVSLYDTSKDMTDKEDIYHRYDY